ncbi:hypothetical protein AJ79_01355 [Helicocarpus griseus UAMH5409]|uniref:Uncharacterized protein n=1 Tax=Helicocarpus griseus UAMH5409 TaxID=1447875 RepID=A0A2B7Y7D8_9EURO|nr:hypothetical protein AJ79_01355 [Helicocarpus griseus UAMH5409]
MATLTLADIAVAKAKKEVPWLRTMQDCGFPVTDPFDDDAIPNHTVLITAICNYVETSGSKHPILSAYPPNPETGEPQPTFSYERLLQFIISNKSRLALDEDSTFHELTRRRRCYFSAYELFFKSDSAMRDLFAERYQLYKKHQEMKSNPEKFTAQELNSLQHRLDINERECDEERTIHDRCVEGIAACTTRLAEIKEKTVALVRKTRSIKYTANQQRKQHGCLNSGINKTPTTPVKQASPIGNNSITKRCTPPLQPASVAGKKRGREYEENDDGPNKRNKGFEVTALRLCPDSTISTAAATKLVANSVSKGSHGMVGLAEVGLVSPPRSSPLRIVAPAS